MPPKNTKIRAAEDSFGVLGGFFDFFRQYREFFCSSFVIYKGEEKECI